MSLHFYWLEVENGQDEKGQKKLRMAKRSWKWLKEVEKLHNFHVNYDLDGP